MGWAAQIRVESRVLAMLLQCVLGGRVCLFVLSCRKIIKGCFLFYCLEFVCTLGSGGAMCRGVLR